MLRCQQTNEVFKAVFNHCSGTTYYTVLADWSEKQPRNCLVTPCRSDLCCVSFNTVHELEVNNISIIALTTEKDLKVDCKTYLVHTK